MTYRYPYHKASEQLKRNVWAKGRPLTGYDPSNWRVDACGRVMKYIEHANTSSDHRWEIDHIRPVSKGGPNDLSNLQPLYWANNRRKGDTYPWYCENAA